MRRKMVLIGAICFAAGIAVDRLVEHVQTQKYMDELENDGIFADDEFEEDGIFDDDDLEEEKQPEEKKEEKAETAEKKGE